MSDSSKGVSDPIHGSIELNAIESEIISTQAFQRLRGVKHLGLAHQVFPSADYSRFSHSLGVCHVTQRIISALKRADVKISKNEELCYRLAGLLHDVGHYPYSHAMEQAVEDHYAGMLFEDINEATLIGPSNAVENTHWLNHESVGKEVLRSDEAIGAVLKRARIKPEDIYSIFARERPPRFANLISSDLDADRIDFLLRTAHHTGLPYGAVDLNYLLSQLRVDKTNHICVDPKALRTVDHFLLGRYFDYQQVAFNKTVVGLELVLKDVLKALLDEGILSCSAKDVQARIRSADWCTFDDTRILELVRQLAAETNNEIIRTKATSILTRRPPKLVASVEHLGSRDQSTKANLLLQRRLAIEHRRVWAERFNIPESLWYVWDKAGLVLTKIGSRVPVSSLSDKNAKAADNDKAEQAIRILNPRDGSSTPIMNVKRSLMSVLSDNALYSLRIYVILTPEREKDRATIEEHIRNDLSDLDWN